jgi:hypothetical protein
MQQHLLPEILAAWRSAERIEAGCPLGSPDRENAHLVTERVRSVYQELAAGGAVPGSLLTTILAAFPG